MGSFFQQIATSDTRIRLTFFIMISILIAVSWLGFLDLKAIEFVDESLVQSTVAFGLAKVLNGLVSVAQSTQVGVGVSVSIGELLDPFNDLVEQYSSAMKLSIVSLFFQKLLIALTSSLFFKITITLSALLLIGAVYYKYLSFIGFLAKTFVFLFLIRFAVILAVFFNGVVDRAFTSKLTDTELKKIEEVANNESLRELKEEAEVKKQLEEKITFLEGKKQATEDEISEVVSQKHKINENIAELESDLAKEKEKSGFIDNLISNSERVKELKTKISQKEDKLTELNKKYSTLEDMLDETNEEIEEKQNTLVGKSNGVFDSLGNKLSELGESVTGAFDTNRLKQLKESMESSTSNMLNLIALFLFKTLFLPLLFLYLIIKGTNAIWNIEIRQKIKEAKDDLLGTVDNTADEKKSVS